MHPPSVEWPTVAVAAADLGGLALLLWWGDRLPWPLTVALLAVLAAWYNSLQHEVIHGHPTPSRRVNDLMGSLPLGLVHPYQRYRETHLAHHRDEFLTEPGVDPESYYVTAEEWDRSGPARRLLLQALQTLPGRTLLGPFVFALRFWSGHLRRARTEPAVRRLLLRHLVAVAAIIAVVWAAPLPVWTYLVGVVWLGWSLSLVRSFAEHRAGAPGRRTAVVRAGRFFSLLYLNNNLHVTHHARPGLAWYRLPEAFERSDDAVVAAEGAGLHSSYLELAAAHLVRPLWSPVHPEVADRS